MLGACLAYIGISLMLGIFVAAVGYRHRIWSRSQLARRLRRSSPPQPRRASSDR